MERGKMISGIKDVGESINFKMDVHLDKLDKISNDVKDIMLLLDKLESRIPERKDGWFGGYWDNNRK